MKKLITVLAIFASCGVCFAQQESAPKDESTTIKVRHAPTTADNAPLYILDSVEISYEDLNKIKPEDIAAINVLKDKSATALYGEKGKNGVIIIELKKPKKNPGQQ
jgi:TonB-dependent SusC/RagA subfamily outer membrane receptor